LLLKEKKYISTMNFAYRTEASGSHYATNALDGQKVPDDVAAGHIDQMLYTASRLNALQVIVKPTRGIARLEPVVDPERSQLDPAVDEYPNVS
jgi:hypothetical protein